MSLSIIVYDNIANEFYDASNAGYDFTYTTEIEEQPGKTVFSIIKTGEKEFKEGNTVLITDDEHKIFKGFIFGRSRASDIRKVKINCYDQMRYLKNKDSRVFSGMTSSQIFASICEELLLKYEVVDASNYVCPPRTEDGATWFEMIQNSLNATLAGTGKYYIIRDNFGTLQHIKVSSLNTGWLLGDAHGVTDFSYETSIDKDVYNQVKLYKDNKDTKKREIYIVNDTINGGGNLRAWGLLQYYESIREDLSPTQIADRATKYLGAFNNVKKTLKISALGIWGINAGSIFTCNMDIGDQVLNSYLLVKKAEHKVTGGKHTMSLDTEVVI